MAVTGSPDQLEHAFAELEGLGPAFDAYRRLRLARVDPVVRRMELARSGMSRGLAERRAADVERLVARRRRSPGWQPGALGRQIALRLGPLGRRKELDPILGAADPGGKVIGRAPHRLDLLLHLAGGYRLRGGWVEGPCLAAPQGPDPVAELVRLGPVDLDELRRALDARGIRRELQLPWIEDLSGYRLVDGRLFSYAEFSVADRAAEELHYHGTALSSAELFARVGPPRCPRDAFDAILESDRRFVRSAWRRFGLVEWGGDPFVGLDQAMCLEIERHGGEMPIAELARILGSRHEVPDKAVLGHGLLRRRVDGCGLVTWEARPPVHPSRQPLAEVPGCFRVPLGWALRIGLTASVLRGDSQAVPSAFADLLDRPTSSSTTIACRPGPLTLTCRRSGPSAAPRLRGLRAAADACGGGRGDLLFLVLRPLGGLQLELRRRRDLDRVEGLARLAAECGGRPDRDPLPEIASALGLARDLPDLRERIPERLRRRGERRLLRLFSSGPGTARGT